MGSVHIAIDGFLCAIPTVSEEMAGPRPKRGKPSAELEHVPGVGWVTGGRAGLAHQERIHAPEPAGAGGGAAGGAVEDDILEADVLDPVENIHVSATARGFVVTINNPPAALVASLSTAEHWLNVAAHPCLKHLSYVCFQGERAATTGTPHLQLYIEFKQPVKRGSVQALLGGHAAIFKRRGTAYQCFKYCRKRATAARDVAAPFEFGDRPVEGVGQGARSDLAVAAALASGGVPGLVAVARDHPSTFVRYHRGLAAMASMLDPGRDAVREVFAIVFLGPTGTGKSRAARALAGDGHYFTRADPRWWPSYRGENYVVIDELGPGQWSYEYALGVVDDQPFHAECKGGGVFFRAETIIITSNVDNVGELWPDKTGMPRADCDAFLRRVRVVRFLPPLEQGGFVRHVWEPAHPRSANGGYPAVDIPLFRTGQVFARLPRDANGRVIRAAPVVAAPAAPAGPRVPILDVHAGDAGAGPAGRDASDSDDGAGVYPTSPAARRAAARAQECRRGKRPVVRPELQFIQREAHDSDGMSGSELDDEDGCMRDPWLADLDSRDRFDRAEYFAWLNEQPEDL